MRSRIYLAAVTAALLPSLATAQGVVADAFRNVARDEGKNLTAAAEVMPADKYSYRPTPKQMSFGEIIVHLAQGNDFLCGSIGGTKAPDRPKVTPTASKEALVARLKETFQFCDQALANLDDSKLGEQLPMFGKTMSRAAVEMVTVGDWADHYSQIANYMRLNGMLPPSALPRPGRGGN